jgi:hypothetical protein
MVVPGPIAFPSFRWPVRATAADAGARRVRRMAALIAAIAVLSAADLYITLLYLGSVGMSEANPLARWVMATSSTGFLVWWKSLSVGLACAIFWTTRRHRSAEAAAWACCALLVWLTVRWTAYSHEVAKLTPAIGTLALIDDGRWVTGPDRAGRAAGPGPEWRGARRAGTLGTCSPGSDGC